jgi:hypothetical protein
MTRMVYFGVQYDSVQLQQQTSTAPARLMYRGVSYDRNSPTPAPAYTGILCYRGVQYRKHPSRDERDSQLIAAASPQILLNRIRSKQHRMAL